MFKKKVVETKYQIVEVEKSLPLQEVGPELKESLKALQFHPAFQYLVNRLALKKAALATALHEGLDLSETQLRYLQAGIFWMGHLDREIKVLTQSPQASPRPASNYETEEFQKFQASLELVGA